MERRMSESKKKTPPPLEANLVQDNIPVRIRQNLFIGSKFSGYNLEALKEFGITHILNASSNPSSFPSMFIYLSLNIRDNDDANILSCIPAANIFIKAGIESGGCLVHCHFGRSRSSALIAAFLMLHYNQTYNDSIEQIRKIRSVAAPNAGFELQLQAYESTKCDTYLAQKLPCLAGYLNPARHRLSRRRSSGESDLSSVCSTASNVAELGSPHTVTNEPSTADYANSNGLTPDAGTAAGSSDGMPIFLPSLQRESRSQKSMTRHRRASSIGSTSSQSVTDVPSPRSSPRSSGSKVIYVLKNDPVRDVQVLAQFALSCRGCYSLPHMDGSPSDTTSTPYSEGLTAPPLPPRGRIPPFVHAVDGIASTGDTAGALPDIVLTIEEDEECSESNSTIGSNVGSNTGSATDELLDVPPSLRSMKSFKSNSFTGLGTPAMRRSQYKKSSSLVNMKPDDNWGSDLGYNPESDSRSIRSDSLAGSELDPLEQFSGQFKVQAFLEDDDEGAIIVPLSTRNVSARRFFGDMSSMSTMSISSSLCGTTTPDNDSPTNSSTTAAENCMM